MEQQKPENLFKEYFDQSQEKLSIDSFDLLVTIGTGMFSRVFLAKSKECCNSKPIALKMIKKFSVIKEKQVDYVYAEKHVMSLLNHSFITKLLHSFQDQRYVYFVLEYACGGELFTRMKKMGNFSSTQCQFYAAEIILALEYLHSKNIAYRDLKPENILIDRAGHVKLADFGFSKQISEKCYTLCGTSEYLAPEILMNKGYSLEIDWWALGILIFEMLTGELPFTGSSPHIIYQKILLGRVNFPAFLEQSAICFILGLLEQNPSKRLGFKDGQGNAKNHEWLGSIDFNLLIMKEMPPPWVPEVQNDLDTSCFKTYPESASECPTPKLNTARDPFSGF